MADLLIRDKLIALVREQMPVGILPLSDELLLHWVEDAAEQINDRRRKTTKKEINITLVADTQAYDLPEDCQRVEGFILEGQNLPFQRPLLPGFPLEAQVLGQAGMLPNGQMITGSVDYIQRMQAQRRDREVAWRVAGRQIVLDFAVPGDLVGRLIYWAPDRSVEDLPKRYWDPIGCYCRSKGLDNFLTHAATSGDHVGDRLVQFNLGQIRDQAKDLMAAWQYCLNGIIPETDQLS